MNCFQQIFKYEKLLFSKISRRNANIQPTIRWNDLFLRNIRFQIRSSIGKKGSRYYQRGEECYCLFSSTCNSFFFVVAFFSPFPESLEKVATLNFHVRLNASWLVGGALPLFNWNEYLSSRRERQTILRFRILLWSLVKLLNLLFTQFFFFFPLILMSHRQDH